MRKNHQKYSDSRLSKLAMVLILCGGFQGMACAQSTQDSSSADVGKSQSGGTAAEHKNNGRLRSSTTDAFGSTNKNGNMGDAKNSTKTDTAGKKIKESPGNNLSASSGVERTGNTKETAGEWSGTKGSKDPNTDTTSKHNHSD
ncbi:MAG: hypothetical protein V4443_07925 [Pseudomonadota bacterium]